MSEKRKKYDKEGLAKRTYNLNRAQAELLKSIAAAKEMTIDGAVNLAIREWNIRNIDVFDQ